MDSPAAESVVWSVWSLSWQEFGATKERTYAKLPSQIYYHAQAGAEQLPGVPLLPYRSGIGVFVSHSGNTSPSKQLRDECLTETLRWTLSLPVVAPEKKLGWTRSHPVVGPEKSFS